MNRYDAHSPGAILPGATLGVLGGGQLGRLFTLAARTLGYRVLVLDPDPNSPAGAVADTHLCADYTDQQALARMGAECAAITTEWESVPAIDPGNPGHTLPGAPECRGRRRRARSHLRKNLLTRFRAGHGTLLRHPLRG